MNEIYLVQSTAPDGDQFIHEQTLPKMSRDEVVSGIALGDYDVGKIDRVIKMNLTLGQALDVSVLIAGEVASYSIRRERELSRTAQRFIEQYGLDSYVEPDPTPVRRIVRRGNFYPYFGGLSR